MRRSVVFAPALIALFLGGCANNPTDAAKPAPAVVDTVVGSDQKRVTLTNDAVERISLETGAVSSGSGTETVVPYGAVIYDAEGLAWAYVSKGDNAYLRESIDIDRIEGDKAYLRSGPAVGIEVAIVGVAELYGAETGIGK